MKNLQILNEYSFSRVYDRLKNGNAAMLTAFRGAYSRIENEKRQKELKQELQRLGYSFNEFNGYYLEYEEDSEKSAETKPQLEKSLLVYPKGTTPKIFKNQIIELGAKYEQDSILFIENGEGFLIGASGNDPSLPKGKEIAIGKVTASKIAQAYSERSGKTFIFESILPNGLFSAYAYKATQENYINENDTNLTAAEKINAKVQSLIERGETPFSKSNPEVTELLAKINKNKLIK